MPMLSFSRRSSAVLTLVASGFAALAAANCGSGSGTEGTGGTTGTTTSSGTTSTSNGTTTGTAGGGTTSSSTSTSTGSTSTSSTSTSSTSTSSSGSASCGEYTDVVYHTTGTFAITDTPFNAGNQTFTGLTANASTPVFTGSGDTTPFSVPPPSGGASFTNGMVRLRFTNDATGNPIAGTVALVEWYFPLEFKQTAGATLLANVDHSVGLLAAGLANCGGGDAACTNHAPALSRKCEANATGTLSGTTLTWGACTPAPTGQTSWNFVAARAATGAGCATGYNAWGNVTCTTGCGLVPAAGLGDSFQTWNQAMPTLTFSSTDYKTATISMGASETMEIPNGTGDSVTTLAITSSTVVSTHCGSTPGTDLVCNVQ